MGEYTLDLVRCGISYDRFADIFNYSLTRESNDNGVKTQKIYIKSNEVLDHSFSVGTIIENRFIEIDDQCILLFLNKFTNNWERALVIHNLRHCGYEDDFEGDTDDE